VVMRWMQRIFGQFTNAAGAGRNCFGWQFHFMPG
jgi:hypothetical protein